MLDGHAPHKLSSWGSSGGGGRDVIRDALPCRGGRQPSLHMAVARLAPPSRVTGQRHSAGCSCGLQPAAGRASPSHTPRSPPPPLRQCPWQPFMLLRPAGSSTHGVTVHGWRRQGVARRGARHLGSPVTHMRRGSTGSLAPWLAVCRSPVRPSVCPSQNRGLRRGSNKDRRRPPSRLLGSLTLFSQTRADVLFPPRASRPERVGRSPKRARRAERGGEGHRSKD